MKRRTLLRTAALPRAALQRLRQRGFERRDVAIGLAGMEYGDLKMAGVQA